MIMYTCISDATQHFPDSLMKILHALLEKEFEIMLEIKKERP
jgi:hypothetical protein